MALAFNVRVRESPRWPSWARPSILVLPVPGRTSSSLLVNDRQGPPIPPREYAPYPVSPCPRRWNFRSKNFHSVDLFSWFNDYPHAEVFANYARFSSGASHDLRACRGIERKCCRVLKVLNLGRLPEDWDAAGGASLGKQEFWAFARVLRWMLS